MSALGLGGIFWWLLGGHNTATAKCATRPAEKVCWPVTTSYIILWTSVGMSIIGSGMVLADLADE